MEMRARKFQCSLERIALPGGASVILLAFKTPVSAAERLQAKAQD